MEGVSRADTVRNKRGGDIIEHLDNIRRHVDEATRKKQKGSPFTVRILSHDLPGHFRPVTFEYLLDHVCCFDNTATLHQFSD